MKNSHKFMRDMCEWSEEEWCEREGKYEGLEFETREEKLVISVKSMYEMYNDWKDDSGLSNALSRETIASFGKDLLVEEHVIKNKGKIREKKSAWRYVITVSDFREALFVKYKFTPTLKTGLCHTMDDD